MSAKAPTGTHRREPIPRDSQGKAVPAPVFQSIETPAQTENPTPEPAGNPATSEDLTPEDLTPDASDWSDVLTSTPAVVFTRERVDVERDIPRPIRDMLEKSFNEYIPPTDAGNMRTAKPAYYTHDFGSPQRASKFIDLAKKYGRYRPAGTITVRATAVKGAPNKVRYCSKPLELKGKRSKPAPVPAPVANPTPDPTPEPKPDAASSG